MTTRRNTGNDKRRTSGADSAGAARTAAVGIVEWFRPGEQARVDRVLADLAALGVKELRTGVSWQEYYTDPGRRWYEWLLPHLAEYVRVLPCFSHRGT